MINERNTECGRLLVGPRDELFAMATALAVAEQAKVRARPFSWALTGGSTPAAFYRWCVTTRAMPAALAEHTLFTVSDERCVPLESDQSNFGNAERDLLAPLRVPARHRHPWPVSAPPHAAAEVYAHRWQELAGAGRTYDVCFLGMGDDGHTASIFPDSPLVTDDGGRLFSAIEVPGKGWRLTVTPSGLAACGLIVVMTLGAGKAAMLQRVLTGPKNPLRTPVQLLGQWRSRVVWLVDEAAAAAL